MLKTEVTIFVSRWLFLISGLPLEPTREAVFFCSYFAVWNISVCSCALFVFALVSAAGIRLMLGTLWWFYLLLMLLLLLLWLVLLLLMIISPLLLRRLGCVCYHMILSPRVLIGWLILVTICDAIFGGVNILLGVIATALHALDGVCAARNAHIRGIEIAAISAVIIIIFLPPACSNFIISNGSRSSIVLAMHSVWGCTMRLAEGSALVVSLLLGSILLIVLLVFFYFFVHLVELLVILLLFLLLTVSTRSMMINIVHVIIHLLCYLLHIDKWVSSISPVIAFFFLCLVCTAHHHHVVFILVRVLRNFDSVWYALAFFLII